MVQKILITLFLLGTFSIFAQEERILISEKKQGKRVVLFAQNTTKDSLNVFLMVTSEGYRRSADRPIIKNIPPLSKTPMITLIEISNVPSKYDYTLVVNEKENDLNFSRQKREVDIEEVISGKLVLFTSEECEKCEALSTTLEVKNIAHRSFNITKDPVLYDQFINFIQKKQPEKVAIQIPMIWNKDHAIYGYDNLEEIISELMN